jgi:hypothetical protein
MGGSRRVPAIAGREHDFLLTCVARNNAGFRAKTSIFVPELNRLYIAVSGKGRADAKLALQVCDVRP